MIKNDLVNRVTEETGVPRVQASRAVETIIEAMRRSLAGGGRIELRGFGVFLVKRRKRGIGRNPKRPDEQVEIPPGFTIRFKPGKELRDLMIVEPAAPAAEPTPPASPEPA
jgi:DNA-binding protein HU-beta